MRKMYEVTRKFTSGILRGLTHTEVTSVKFRVGWECKKPIGESSYKIISCYVV